MTNSEILFSVCISAYNGEKYIRDTIKSVLGQTCQDYEIVIVNDGSIDNTEGIIKEFTNEKIRYFYKKHTGIPDSVNRLIKESLGRYIVNLAQDDLLLPNALEVYKKYIERFPDVGIFYCNLLHYYDNEGTILPDYFNDWYNKHELLISYSIIASQIPAPGSVISKKTHSIIGEYDKTYLTEDGDFFTRAIMSKKIKFKLIEEFIILYRRHGNNISIIMDLKDKNKEKARVLRSRLSENPINYFFEFFDWSCKFNESFSEACYIIGLRFFAYESYSDSLFYFTASLKYSINKLRFKHIIIGFIEKDKIQELKYLLFLLRGIDEYSMEIEEINKIIGK